MILMNLMAKLNPYFYVVFISVAKISLIHFAILSPKFEEDKFKFIERLVLLFYDLKLPLKLLIRDRNEPSIFQALT